MQTRFEEDAFGRSVYKAALESQYGIQLNQLNETFYGRWDRLLTFASLLAGAGVTVNFFQSLGPFWNGILGLIVASCAAVQAIWQPANCAAAHREGKKTFFALDAVVRGLSIDEAFARIGAIRASLPAGFDALAQPAYNRTLRANGHPPIELHWSEQMAEAFAC